MRGSVLLKLFLTTVIALLLLVPTGLIEELIDERQATRTEAEDEISGKWGSAQTIGGPVLTVPYISRMYDAKNQLISTRTDFAHFIPTTLAINGQIRPQVLHRGIYDVVLYGSTLDVSGTFDKPDFREWNIRDADIQWKDAFITFGIPDMRGIKETIKLKWNDTILPFQPGLMTKDIYESGVSVPFDATTLPPEKATNTFSFKVVLNGSKYLNFLPLGRETHVKLASDWSNPSFSGAFLPETRSVSDSGFTAEWKVLDMNRNLPHAWVGQNADFANTEFRVELMLPVDGYQKATRSVKYAAMFIGLTFLTFFLVEILNKMRLHPIQYLLVGLAIVIFYLLELSFSERMSFDMSYLIGSAGVVGLITMYMGAIFQNRTITSILFVILALLYGYLYVLLQMQDNSLILGSVGLFLILALVMYLTRKINWYEISLARDANKSVEPTI